MKYIAVLDSENEFTEEVINDLKNTGFLGDNPRYAFAIEDIQEHKEGKWIVKNAKKQGYDIAGIKTWYIQIVCNKCGFTKTAIEGHTGQYNYCPNCGAEMRGNEKGRE